MKASKSFVIFVFIVIIITMFAFFPVIDVNVVFDRALNSNEIATAFKGTSFRSNLYYSVSGSGAMMGVIGNAELFGAPLEGVDLYAAIKANPRSAGIIVIEGTISFIDMVNIRRSAFVYDVMVYFPLFHRHGNRILPAATATFFERRPETRFWEQCMRKF